jgi:hypothetical protein
MTTPLGRRIVLQASGQDGNYEVATTDTDVPGTYTLRATIAGQERAERFVVRPSIAEADLKPLSELDWSRLQRGLGFQRINPSARAIVPIATAGQEGRELWLPLLLGAFALVALELMLTRFWSEGR